VPEVARRVEADRGHEMDDEPDGRARQERRPAAPPPFPFWSITRRGVLGRCSGGLLPPAAGAGAQSAAPARPPPRAPGRAAGRPPPLGPMRINYSAIAAPMAGIWAANDTGAWQEDGIEPELFNVNASSKVLPALIANDIDASSLDVMAGVRAIADGG